MVIAVDIDDVCADLISAWLKAIKREFSVSLERKDIQSWAINEYVPKEVGNKVYDLLTAEMYLEVEPIEGALYGVEALRKRGHRVIFVTSTPKGCEGAKLAWLKRFNFLDDKGAYGDGRVYSDYIECHDKSLIRADLLIDDRDKNIEDFPGATILFDRTHNRKMVWASRAIGWGETVKWVDRIEMLGKHGLTPEPAVPTKHITEQRCPEQVKAFREVIEEMYSLHLRKNADYSPLNLQGTGDLGVVVRAWDKMSRLMSLTGFRLTANYHGFEGGKEPSNESVDDSWIDLANYAVIALLMRRGVWGK